MELWEEDGILHCTFTGKLHMDLTVAKSCVEDRILFSKGISYPVLIDMRNLRSVTKEAREYMAGKGAELITAGALLINSSLTRILGNIFLQINKPPRPSRLFSDKEEAKAWLKQFR